MSTIVRLPFDRGQLKVGPFAAWLVKMGAQVGTPTNAYEVIRYRAYSSGGQRAETHIVYAKESGRLTFTGKSQAHYEAFLRGEAVAGMFVSKLDGAPNPSTPKAPDAPSLSAKRRNKLLARDGDCCWFCGVAMGDDVTIEHLVAKAKGGTNHLENFALAHRACNALAGDKPLIEKIALRARLRADAGVDA